MLLIVLPVVLCWHLALASGGDAGVQHDARDSWPFERVVFSLTTLPRRIKHLKPVVDALVEAQTQVADAVYLAVPPMKRKLPSWLEQYNQSSSRPGLLRVLHMRADYGPASKLLAAVAEGQERGKNSTLIIYGDDDVLYSPQIIQQHVDAQRTAASPTAFGTRLIHIGEGRKRASLLEGVGSVSVRASYISDAFFRIVDTLDVCKLSDDYWISRHLTQSGVRLQTLPDCGYNFNTERWSPSCGQPFHHVDDIRHIDALSETVMAGDGSMSQRFGGDWRAQLKRYEDCQASLDALERDEF
mmetsp:Transcript_13391/g.24635  ORF Transcript_13391/g.24635 Transcript_13391/m.24635 type:complete len:299 (-) Transcript_13391:10-906(-)